MNIGYKLIKNCMAATAEKAPYLGMAIPVGSLAYDNILKEMIKSGTKMTQPTAKYFLDALYEFAAERIAAEQVRINVGTVSIYPMIDGSFDSEDAPFDPKRNSLYVGATLSQELRDRVAGIAPDFTGDTSAGTVKLHSCMDLETQVFKVIRGTGSFRLAGANLTVPDGPDESLGLFAKNGVDKVADIEVSETDGGQRITCRLKQADKAIPKGVYKVRLASHGLDPTDPLTVVTLTVTLVEAIPAGPVPLAQSADGRVKIMSIGDFRTDESSGPVTGTELGLDEASGQGIGSATAQVGGKTVAWTNESREGIDAESATFALDESSELPPEGRYTADLTFVRTKADGETENLVVHDAPILIAEP